MKKIFFLAAFAFVAVVGAAPAEATGSSWLYTQSCTLSAGADDILVDFGGARIFSDRYPNILSKSVSIPAGRYDVYVQSFDGYKGRAYTSASTQKNEQFYIEFNSGSHTANTTNTTPDLEDGVDKAHWSGKINTNMGIGRDVNKVLVHHAVKYYNPNPNSLTPVCMVLKPRPVDGVCNSALDGKTLDHKPTSNLCSTGHASSVSGSGSQSSPWTWSCGGKHGGKTDHCSAYKANVCGDGVVAGAEQCDDGNTTNGDGCSAQCTVERPAIEIIKRDAADKDDTQTVTQGENATFEIIVKNTGEVDLKDVRVTDAQTPACAKTIGNLAVGQSRTYTCIATNVRESFTNIAHVTGSGVNNTGSVTDEDPTKVVVEIPGTPAIEIIKRDAADKDDTQTVTQGENATFEIIVKNTGEVDLKDVKVRDPYASVCDKTIGDLAVGQQYVYTCTTEGVMESYTNVANVTGTPVDGQNPVTDKDPTEIIVEIPGKPSIKIIKRDAADKDDTQTIEKGGNATFQIVVKNTGDVDLKDVKVRDPYASVCNKNIGDLAVGERHVYTCTTEGVMESYTNVANVTGAPVDGQEPVKDKDPTEIIVEIPGTPAIEIIKRDASDKDDTQTIDEGETARFEIVVTNTGDVDLKDVRVTDAKESDCDKTIGDLAVGASKTYTCASTDVTKSFTNVANVTGTPVDGQDAVTDEDPTEIVVRTPQGPVCGNGVKEEGEQCDDGNTKNGDGCSAQCTIERVIVDPVCGNGIKEAGEQCDDGNRSNNDECSNQCKIIEEEEEEEEDDDDCDAEVGDTVFNDRNRNGVQDPGEPGLAGIRVKLQYGDKVKKTRTDSNGEYDFDDLCEDNYRVIIGVESLDAGCYQTYDRDGKLDHMNKVGLDEGEEYEKVDFGYYCPAAYTPRHVEHRPVSPRTGAGPLAGGAAAVFASGAVWLYQRRQMQESVEKSIITFDN